jgi:DNA-binding IclR family transcriptional regulator
LAERGYFKKDSKTDKYKLGIKFFELGSVVIKNMDLRKIAHPYIEKLSKEFNETVHLGILDKGRVVSIEREESDKSLCSHIEIGRRAPLHCTAVGKAIMSYLSENEINLIIKEKGLEKYTENTITNKEKLEEEFKKIRKQGYAVDNIEHEEGVRCVAGPIRDYNGKVIASMSISGPAFRIDESNIPNIAKKVKEYCDCISEEMGCINSSSK